MSGEGGSCTLFSRCEAARLVTGNGRTIAVVAQEIGVSMQLLGRSVVIERAKAVDPQGILGEDERGELQRFNVNALGFGWTGRSANESGGYCGVIAVSRQPSSLRTFAKTCCRWLSPWGSWLCWFCRVSNGDGRAKKRQ